MAIIIISESIIRRSYFDNHHFGIIYTITIGGITFDGTGNDNWIGKPDANGICMVSYEKDDGVIFNWNGGYSGTIEFSKNSFLNYDTLNRTGNIDKNTAYFSNQTFRIG
ncbi:hypothetical protein ACTNE0_12180 [Bacillota bacterium HCP3S3_E9]